MNAQSSSLCLLNYRKGLVMLNVEGRAWLNLTDEGDFEAKNESVLVEVQRTDDNEVRIGIRLYASGGDDATVYFTVAEAGRLAHMLGIAVLANEAAAHEAASL